MSIRPDELQTPEDGLELDNREARAPRPSRRRKAARAPAGAPEELVALRARIGAAAQLTPQPGVACADCWRQGRDDALAAMMPGRSPLPPEEELRRLRAGIEQARAMRPKGLHYFQPWQAGRDAALRVVEGER